MTVNQRLFKIVAAAVLVATLLVGVWWLRRSFLQAGAERDAAIARGDSALAHSAQAQASRDSLRTGLAASRKRVQELLKLNSKVDSANLILDKRNDSLKTQLDSLILDPLASASDSARFWKAKAMGYQSLYETQIQETANFRIHIVNDSSVFREKDGQLIAYENQIRVDSVAISNLRGAVKDLQGIAQERCLLGLIKCPSRSAVFLTGAVLGFGLSEIVDHTSPH